MRKNSLMGPFRPGDPGSQCFSCPTLGGPADWVLYWYQVRREYHSRLDPVSLLRTELARSGSDSKLHIDVRHSGIRKIHTPQIYAKHFSLLRQKNTPTSFKVQSGAGILSFWLPNFTPTIVGEQRNTPA